MKQLKPLVFYSCIQALTFYLLPLLVRDTGSGMLILLAVLPAVVFLSALICGVRHGFSFLLPLAAGLLFLPVPFLYFNDSALIYVPAYAVISLVGSLIGHWIHRLSGHPDSGR